MCRSKWFLAGFSLFLGVFVFVALWVGGDATGGVYAAAVLLAFGLFVLLAGARSRRSAACAATAGTSASG